MKYDIILAGVGGQGILSIATVMGRAVMAAGLHLKQSEVHGMAQRGGAVQAHVRISDDTIYSDVIPHRQADMILAVEPMEALRYLPWLQPYGWVVANETPMMNIGNYPSIDAICQEVKAIKKHVLFNADQTARDVGNIRAMNMVMLGAASVFITMVDAAVFEQAIKEQFIAKGDHVVAMNLDAFQQGRSVGQRAAAAS